MTTPKTNPDDFLKKQRDDNLSRIFSAGGDTGVEPQIESCVGGGDLPDFIPSEELGDEKYVNRWPEIQRRYKADWVHGGYRRIGSMLEDLPELVGKWDLIPKFF